MDLLFSMQVKRYCECSYFIINEFLQKLNSKPLNSEFYNENICSTKQILCCNQEQNKIEKKKKLLFYRVA